MVNKLLEFHGSGLSSNEAEKNIERFGLNEIELENKKSAWSIFLNQFKDILVVILALSTAVSFLLGEFLDAVVIFFLIILNGILGFVQEFRAERAIESLKNYVSYKAKVIRDGKVEQIETKFVTVNDIVIIEEGDRIPADGILLENFSLSVDESILTGESMPVEKDIKEENKLYMGSYVVKGRGVMKVTSIGLDTKMGKIAKALTEIEETKTPLQMRLSQLGKLLALVCLSICAIIVVLGILRKQNIYEMFMIGISLAVAAIPEGLPAVVTITLAIGVQRMAKKNALIRKLSSVETLGCVNIICSDKTGTLTENKMTVKRLETVDMSIEVEGIGYDLKGRILSNGQIVKNQLLDYIMMCAINCNNAEFEDGKNKQFKVSGDPTEIALLVLARKYRESFNRGERIIEIPFDSQRRYMGVVVKYDQNNILFVKGAFEKLIDKCKYYMGEDGTIRQLGYNEKRIITKKNESMCMSSMRVLLLCMKYGSETVDGMILLGLVGMIDPAKRGVKLAIEKAKRAGVKTIMITGDHKLTAFSIAKELGIVSSFEEVVEGEELEKNEKIVERNIDKISVFARVDPLHKLKIVKMLKKKGNIIAVTGDGVNDAPAIKEADIGIAMGISGSDVTKEAASMILLDDNYTTIVHAIEEGRLIYNNIRKFIKYLLACNIGEVLIMLFTSLLNLPIALLPMQILWVNLVTDGLPAAALSMSKRDESLMRQKPRPKNESIFAGGLLKEIILRGFSIGCFATLSFYIPIMKGYDIKMARTVAFATLVLSQLIYSFECSTQKRNIFNMLFGNLYLLFSVIISFVLFLLVIYIPQLGIVFEVSRLGYLEWGIIIICSLFPSLLHSIFAKNI